MKITRRAKKRLLKQRAKRLRELTLPPPIVIYGNVGHRGGSTSVFGGLAPLKNNKIQGCNHKIRGVDCGRHTVGIEDKCDLHL
jgi:hypothetical protein